MRPILSPTSLSLGLLMLALPLTSCRSKGDSVDPSEAQPRESIDLTEAEADRNERFSDRRKRRYRSGQTLDGSPAPASAVREAEAKQQPGS